MNGKGKGGGVVPRLMSYSPMHPARKAIVRITSKAISSNLSFRFDHRLEAIAADDVDGLRGSDALTTAGTEILAGTALFGGSGERSTVGRSVAACDAVAAGFVAVEADFLDIVGKQPFDESVGDHRAGIAPSVLVSTETDKAVTLSGGAEQLVMVGAASGHVLHVENGVIIHMDHLMEQGGNGVLKGSVKGPGTDVDLVLHLIAVDGPNGRDGIVAVGSGGGLNRDDGGLKLIVEEIFVQHTEQLLKLTCKAGSLDDGFHGSISLHS